MIFWVGSLRIFALGNEEEGIEASRHRGKAKKKRKTSADYADYADKKNEKIRICVGGKNKTRDEFEEKRTVNGRGKSLQ